MGRLGLVHDKLLHDLPRPDARADQEQGLASVQTVTAIQDLDGLEVEGMYTHLANADARDKTQAKAQVRRFSQMADQLASAGRRPGIIHAANSAALIDLPCAHFDMVRPGIALYGLWPSDEVDRSRLDLMPAMAIRSKIIQVKSVPKGFAVSYGATHVTDTPTRIATVPIGYADGYSRLLSNQGQMLVRGRTARVIGRVCMDFTMIDVGHIPDAEAGDEVTIMGAQGENAISADDIARVMGTINYEVTAGLTRRMPIRYTNA